MIYWEKPVMEVYEYIHNVINNVFKINKSFLLFPSNMYKQV